MLGEFTSSEVFAADLALNHHHWAALLDMFSQFGSSKCLELSKVANVTAILQAFIKLSMLLQIANRLPLSLRISVTLMWKFTIVDAVSYDWVNFLKEVALYLATWAAKFTAYRLLSLLWAV